MTYVVVFDITEQIAAICAIGVIALVGAVAGLLLAIRQDSRSFLRATSSLWVGAGGLLWAAFEIHNTGLPLALLLGGVGAGVAVAPGIPRLAGCCADAARQDPTRPFRCCGCCSCAAPADRPPGVQQLSAFDLADRLAAGDATVITGPVQDVRGDSGGYECFTVGDHRLLLRAGRPDLHRFPSGSHERWSHPQRHSGSREFHRRRDRAP